MKIGSAETYERERLKALDEYFTPDSLPEADFDEITAIASEICGTPISLVCIDCDKHWFKSSHGIKIPHTVNSNSFCIPAISSPGKVVIIPDLTKDKQLREHPLVTGKPHAIFYAGVALVSPGGYPLGALCVLDTQTRKLTTRQTKILKSLAGQVVSLLELRKKTILLKQKQADAASAYADIEKIAAIASHDLKSPINNIISLANLLNDDYGEKLNEEGKEYLSFLNEAAYNLSDIVSGIVGYMRASQIATDHKEDINIPELITEISGLLNIPANATIKYKKDNSIIHAARAVIKQALLYLVHNALRYNNSSKAEVEIKYLENKYAYTFEVTDNGPGMTDEDKEKIFNLFERLEKVKNGESMGIGLTIVKRLVEKAGGEIKVDSVLGKGSSFVFTIPK